MSNKASLKLRGLFAAVGIAACLSASLPAESAAQVYGKPETPLFREVEVPAVGIEQKLGAHVPRDLVFTGENGEPVEFASLLGPRPVVLSLMYYECPMLCTEILNGMLAGFGSLPQDIGRDFDVVTISFDHRETHELAAQKKKMALASYGRDGAETGWRFLTGTEENIARLADAVGFGYEYDPDSGQYAHGSAIMILTPAGRVSQYLFGIEYAPLELQHALEGASQNQVGRVMEEIIMRCFLAYSVPRGQYTISVYKTIRFFAGLTVLLLAAGVAWLFIQEKRRKRHQAGAALRGDGPAPLHQ